MILSLLSLQQQLQHPYLQNQEGIHPKARAKPAVTFKSHTFLHHVIACAWHITPQCTMGHTLDSNKIKQ